MRTLKLLLCLSLAAGVLSVGAQTEINPVRSQPRAFIQTDFKCDREVPAPILEHGGGPERAYAGAVGDWQQVAALAQRH